MINDNQTNQSTEKDIIKKEELRLDTQNNQDNSSQDNSLAELSLDKRKKFEEDYFYPFVIDTDYKRIRPSIPSALSAPFLKLRENFYVNGTLKADATILTVNGTQGETVLNSFTIPANTLSRNKSSIDKAGNVFRITASGIYTTDDDLAVCNVYAKVNSTQLHGIGFGSKTITNYPFLIQWLIITTSSYWSSYFTSNVRISSTGTSVPMDSSAIAYGISNSSDITLSLVASWANSSAGDTLTIRQFLVELLN